MTQTPARPTLTPTRQLESLQVCRLPARRQWAAAGPPPPLYSTRTSSHQERRPKSATTKPTMNQLQNTFDRVLWTQQKMLYRIHSITITALARDKTKSSFVFDNLL